MVPGKFKLYVEPPVFREKIPELLVLQNTKVQINFCDWVILTAAHSSHRIKVKVEGQVDRHSTFRTRSSLAFRNDSINSSNAPAPRSLASESPFSPRRGVILPKLMSTRMTVSVKCAHVYWKLLWDERNMRFVLMYCCGWIALDGMVFEAMLEMGKFANQFDSNGFASDSRNNSKSTVPAKNWKHDSPEPRHEHQYSSHPRKGAGKNADTGSTMERGNGRSQRKNPPTNGIVWLDSHMRKSGVIQSWINLFRSRRKNRPSTGSPTHYYSCRFGWLLTMRSWEPIRVKTRQVWSRVGMQVRGNRRSPEILLAIGIVWHVSHVRDPGSDPAGDRTRFGLVGCDLRPAVTKSPPLQGDQMKFLEAGSSHQESRREWSILSRTLDNPPSQRFQGSQRKEKHEFGGAVNSYYDGVKSRRCPGQRTKNHKHIEKKWEEALSASKQTPRGRPSAPDIMAGNLAKDVFVVVTVHQQDVQTWGMPSADIRSVFSRRHHGQGPLQFLRHCVQEANSLGIAPTTSVGIRKPEKVEDPWGGRVRMDRQAGQLTPKDKELLSPTMNTCSDLIVPQIDSLLLPSQPTSRVRHSHWLIVFTDSSSVACLRQANVPLAEKTSFVFCPTNNSGLPRRFNAAPPDTFVEAVHDEVSTFEVLFRGKTGATVAERLACSPPTKVNRLRSPAEVTPGFSQM
ncbi:hypothetical protein PR048_006349 [Dryococelus australis]|uniref:Uncharacterized protein n=1 Tax=Dryococelus australis TaxID=614101 RepID=A0ABQ9IAR1_9NEOP|nr:hypothetical protein PR048_006349 [Dryococelus australis]